MPSAGNILLVAATPLEVALIAAALEGRQTGSANCLRGTWRGLTVDVLTTGVGMTNTALSMGRQLALQQYDALWNIGVCGSYDAELPPVTLCHIVEDTFAELGAEDEDEAFLTLRDLDFVNFIAGGQTYYNTMEQLRPLPLDLPRATALTVNTVHGSERSIDKMTQRWDKQLESMEGAAFFQAALTFGRSFTAVRAVSNFVEPRNTSRWRLKEAAQTVQEYWLETAPQFY